MFYFQKKDRAPVTCGSCSATSNVRGVYASAEPDGEFLKEIIMAQRPNL